MAPVPRRARNAKGKRRAKRRVWCQCGCNRSISPTQASRHMRGLGPIRVRVAQELLRQAELEAGLIANIRTSQSAHEEREKVREEVPSMTDEEAARSAPEYAREREIIPRVDDYPDQMFLDGQSDFVSGDKDLHFGDHTSVELATRFNRLLKRLQNIDGNTSDNEDSESEDGIDDIPSTAAAEFEVEEVEEMFALEFYNKVAGTGLLLEDEISESIEREAAHALEEIGLSESDLAQLRAFNYKHTYNLTDSAFAALPHSFPSLDIPSYDRIRTRVAFLAGFKPVSYDCCVNSCCCYTGDLSTNTVCPYCNENRYKEDGRTARNHFVYVPIIPRLSVLYRNKRMASLLQYRHSHSHPEPEPDANQPSRTEESEKPASDDFFSGSHYHYLREQNVTVNGQTLNYKHFTDSHDIALGLSTDGFAPYKRRKKTAWPLILFLYNLGPEIRNHRKYIMSVGVIPGPSKPHDMDSFLYPLVEELLKLACGVPAFDALEDRMFCLRAFLVMMFGDMPAVSLALKLKGHNGYCPCRSCEIKGVRAEGGKVNYVPLDRTNCSAAGNPSGVKQYDPHNLPLRTHEKYLKQADEVQDAELEKDFAALSKEYGIKWRTILMDLSSIRFPESFPHDFMHLAFENVLKNLLLHWTVEYKGLDVGTGCYGLEKKVWEEIGARTGKTGDTIPSAYGARVPDISKDRSTLTADNFCFFALFIAPIELHGKFTDERYYDHFIKLVVLIRTCLQFEYSKADIDNIRKGFADWVVEYEELYYQYDPTRLSTCPLTIHALLHVADGIDACGPVWAYWAFPMERYCSTLQRALGNSRRFPYETLNRFVVEDAWLTHIKLYYNLWDKLSTKPKMLRSSHKQAKEYDTCVLLPPRFPLRESIPAVTHKRLIAALTTLFKVNIAVMRKVVPLELEQWGRVRRIDGEDADTMLAVDLCKSASDKRDATYVRYEVLHDRNARRVNADEDHYQETHYGQILRIFRVVLGASAALKLRQKKTIFMAEIKPCDIKARHHTLDIHYYSDYLTPVVIEITGIQCLVGRIKVGDGKWWAVIDRSGSLSRAEWDPTQE